MKLYFTPHTCSLNPHIALIELGLPFELVKVDLKTKKTADGGDYLKINPKGYVPALELDNGDILTEGPVIVQYLGDLKPQDGFIPKHGTIDRTRMEEWLHYIGTELHGSCGPLFNPAMPAEAKEFFKAKLLKRVAYIEPFLEKQDYLVGNRYTPADGYLFIVLGWMANVFKIDIGQWPALAKLVERVGARPSVKRAQEQEAA